MTEGKNLFETAIEQADQLEARKIAEELTEDGAGNYVSGAGAPDLKTSIIDITRPKDARIRELLTKELALSNIDKNEVRLGQLYTSVILSFQMHNENDLASEWLARFNAWLLLNRSVNFEQQKILATQIRSLLSNTPKVEKKELI